MASDQEVPDYPESIPLSELLKNPNEVFSKFSGEDSKPLIITQNGKPTCALVSLIDASLIMDTPDVPYTNFSTDSPYRSFNDLVADLELEFAYKSWNLSTERKRLTGSEEDSENYFPNTGEFVHSWLLQVLNRKIDSQNTFWCSEWWKHPEALCRLTIMWQTWEEARGDYRSLTQWWRDQMDYHIPILMSASGPFRYCKDGFHDSASYRRDAFLIKEPPRGLFDMLE